MRTQPAWVALAESQSGAISRRQLQSTGLSPAQIRALTTRACWQRLWPGVYLTHAGPLTGEARVWGAVLVAGSGAVSGPRTTLWLSQAVDALPSTLDVCIPHARKVRPVAGVAVTRRRDLAPTVQGAGCPPRLRLEIAALDAMAEMTRPEPVVDLALRVLQRRLTTVGRLRCQLENRRTHPWRQVISDLLTEAGHGVRSPLELRWVRTVERPHGLPRSTINASEIEGGRRLYRDVRYDRWNVICELDGHEAHPDDARFRDRIRDNGVTVSGRRTLRDGWREVASDPCGTAMQVAQVLRSEGWTGTLTRCSPSCPVRFAPVGKDRAPERP
jgi:hypothetical protein